MKSYLEMNTQEMAEAQRTDPAGYKAMVDAIDAVEVPFDSNGQRMFLNGRPRTNSTPTQFINGKQV